MTTPAENRPGALEAADLTVQGAHAVLLRPTSLVIGAGQVRVVAGEPGHGHTALALALGGRLAYDAGRVTLDGDPAAVRLRRAVALVDVPGVSEPAGAVPLGTVIHEELSFARQPRRGRGSAIEGWAGGLDRRTRFEEVPPEARAALLLRLAGLRRDVRFVVLTLPERYGALPHHWAGPATELAGRGLGVVVTCGLGTLDQVSFPWTRIGARHIAGAAS